MTWSENAGTALRILERRDLPSLLDTVRDKGGEFIWDKLEEREDRKMRYRVDGEDRSGTGYYIFRGYEKVRGRSR